MKIRPADITNESATNGWVLTLVSGVPTWQAAAGGGGSGTVTTVSVVSTNGVSGTVTNATTTPAISLSLGAITPSSVAATGTVTGSNLSGTNTGDQDLSSYATTSALTSGLAGKQASSTQLTALAGAAWAAGTQVVTLTAANTVTLKTVGSAAGNILDKAAGDSLYQAAGSYAPASGSANYQAASSQLTAVAGASWSAGTQVLSLTAANTVTLKTVGASTGNILDKASGDSLYQPLDSDLTSIAALTTTSYGRGLLTTADAAALTAASNAVVGDSGSGGTKGLVPAPAAGDAAAGKYLKADGTWSAPAGGGGGSFTQDDLILMSLIFGS